MDFDIKNRTCVVSILTRMEKNMAKGEGIPVRLIDLDIMIADIKKAFADGVDVEAKVIDAVTGMVVFLAESSRKAVTYRKEVI